ncbi:MAG TPA: L-rhamnose mutarotase [Bacteroidota bacterium]
MKENGTKRICLTLDLREDPSLVQKYQEWHRPGRIWPEIPQGIREVGILDMEIYLLGTRLFMILETETDFDFESRMEELSHLPKQHEWEELMSAFQRATQGAGFSEKWARMERIFKLP